MKTVPLHGEAAAGRVVLVDDEDYDLVMQYKWYVKEGSRGGPYAITCVGSRTNQQNFKMHKLITGFDLTDHRNGNGLDNRRSNLRPATKQTNAWNARARRRRNSGSRYKGVSRHAVAKTRPWRARIKVNGREVALGNFGSEEEAARAFDAAARQYHGEFAYLNFPDLPDQRPQREISTPVTDPPLQVQDT